MRPEVIAAERSREVREAARAWARAGFIDQSGLDRILSGFPDDRTRFGPGFRTLAFVFSGIAALSVVGMSFAMLDPSPSSRFDTVLFLIWALVMGGLTELQRGPLKRASAGAEAATALASVGLALLAVASASVLPRAWETVGLLASGSLFCAIAAWRWGDAMFFAAAVLSAYGLLSQFDQGRLLWVVASLGLIPAGLSRSGDGRRAPSHRRGAAIVGAVAICALYVAVQVWSWDQGLVESLRAGAPWSLMAARSWSWIRPLAILATALLPVALLAAGWRRRSLLLLHLGGVSGGLSIATIRLYHEVMPLSWALILAGAACLALALGARRWLRAGPEGERDGFTADPLFDAGNRTEAIRSVAAMVAFTPAVQAADRPGTFQGGGGRFGGGGASGDY